MYASRRPMPSSKSPFDALEKLRDQLPPGTPKQDVAKPIAPEPKGPARAVVRLERKQRRGKEVTVVEKLGLKTIELEAWCKQLKQAMGCGGTVDGGASGGGRGGGRVAGRSARGVSGCVAHARLSYLHVLWLTL